MVLGSKGDDVCIVIRTFMTLCRKINIYACSTQQRRRNDVYIYTKILRYNKKAFILSSPPYQFLALNHSQKAWEESRMSVEKQTRSIAVLQHSRQDQ